MRMSVAPKKSPTNLSVRTELVGRARKLGLNLSEILEAALEQAVREAERVAWVAENEEAIAAYTAWVEEHGAFGDDWRVF